MSGTSAGREVCHIKGFRLYSCAGYENDFLCVSVGVCGISCWVWYHPEIDGSSTQTYSSCSMSVGVCGVSYWMLGHPVLGGSSRQRQ